ncbi:hypothetical protein [Streptomyces fulvoviolaceus]|uniref:hypothetical protein n=1 Tax=Streptomyces fulvoviolaceus TaxID=285535 RepID=UPI0021C141F7|nr:hypothetical protein [Streptomyces fulvoviolaceus]MCT9075967.1 hypothetical protein [Streptomyces fulvoviolaceus]
MISAVRRTIVATAVCAASVTGTSGAAQAAPTPGYHAFVLDKGRYTSADSPDPAAQLCAFGIDHRGRVSGEYERATDESGFVRDPSGEVTVFDVPGAKGTEAIKINDRGEVVGHYSTDTGLVNDSAKPHGFLRNSRGAFATIDMPGAAYTLPQGLNNRGQVVGVYVDAKGTGHGFRWERGRFTTIDVPGAAGTEILDVNDRGQMVGDYLDRSGRALGFLLDKGHVTTIDPRGTRYTLAFGINDRGRIVGVAVNADQTQVRGFLLAQGPGGPVTPVAFPGADRTVPGDVNERGAIGGCYDRGPPAAGITEATGITGVTG